MSRNNKLSAKIMVVALALVSSHWSLAQSYNAGRAVSEDPSALAMSADLVLVRPAMFGITVIGSAVWLVGLPFSAAGGNVKSSAETLVVGPAVNTFVRCLGCTRAGYRQTLPEDEG